MADKITYSVKMGDSETAILIVANEPTSSLAAIQSKEMGHWSIEAVIAEGPQSG